MRIAARNAKEPQAGYLVANGTRTTHYSIHFYTDVRVLAPFVTFYDAKPQLVKTLVEGKPSTISPNHTCQCSLLILSYNINPSHFSTAQYGVPLRLLPILCSIMFNFAMLG